jgi:KUP system potassium uptake protein
VHVLCYGYEQDRAVPAAVLARRDVRRVPGVGLLYLELVQEIPPMFSCLVDRIPSMHTVFGAVWYGF